jgi:tetratricopeptide (TPR) repeat protein
MAYYLMHQPERAESIFRSELDTLHPWSPIPQFALALVLVEQGRRAEAERVDAQVARQFPGHRAVKELAMLLAASRGDYATAAGIARILRDRYSEGSLDRADADRRLAEIAMTRGRPTEAEGYIRDAMAASVEDGLPANYLRDAATLAFIDTWFRRRPARGLRTVEAALARYPLPSVSLLDRPYLMLALVYASAGRPQQARALLTRYEREVRPTLRHIEDPKRRWTWGQVALAEGRYADAALEFQAYVPAPRHCLPCGQSALALAYDRLGNSDSALAIYERYLATPSVFRAPGSALGLTGLYDLGLFGNDATQLAPTYRRIAELYETRGERSRARAYYLKLLELWKNSEPELAPEVGAVRERLRHLAVGE